ncbi:MAG: hypothetical protein GWO11_03750 [Desulfuromonadales bacterium]|nr:hypothetical protein [Desulfuromonadales bacterium]NIR33554.1 hypothetical protein [Desulfuromonadales bacterium]NIS41144.1 hypothetical protein [Desulfuromonadales bacterium]
MKSRTTREFIFNGDLWPLVDRWAAEAGFKTVAKEKNRRLFQRGIPVVMAPTMVEVRRRKAEVGLQAWVKADPYLVIAVLTGKKPEMGIESGGMTALLPRRRARRAVNALLEALGEEPVR